MHMVYLGLTDISLCRNLWCSNDQMLRGRRIHLHWKWTSENGRYCMCLLSHCSDKDHCWKSLHHSSENSSIPQVESLPEHWKWVFERWTTNRRNFDCRRKVFRSGTSDLFCRFPYWSHWRVHQACPCYEFWNWFDSETAAWNGQLDPHSCLLDLQKWETTIGYQKILVSGEKLKDTCLDDQILIWAWDFVIIV